jgi:asparagine synthase (glutamine-hydrolysing)
MGGFVLIRRGAGKRAARTAAQSFIEQGFTLNARCQTPQYEALFFAPTVAPGTMIVKAEGGDFCAASGTLLYAGRRGAPALEALHDAFDPEKIDPADFQGAFCVLLRKAGRTFMFVDRLGIYKTYVSADELVWSSSFLAVASSLEKCRIERQCVYEYVFQGATYGDATVLRDITLARADRLYEIGDEVRRTAMPGRLSPSEDGGGLDDHVRRNLHNLRRSFGRIVGQWGDDIDTALSGGYDSRLTLALLREQGAAPHVHVYGAKQSADVQVARAIARGEGFALDHQDKSARPDPPPGEALEIARRNFLAMDGWPTDGIFNNGADLETRRARCRDGRLMLNGGGGEVFRNFFYLPGRNYRVGDIIDSFYSQYDPASASPLFDETAYRESLAGKMKQTLGVTDDRLERWQVELLYIIFRCRYWMGRNNSLNSRLGDALTPFIDYGLVGDALAIPLAYKNHGILEARMIAAISPALAAYPSDYGHDFAHPPPVKRRLKDWATMARPPALRRRLFRLKHRRRPPARPRLLGPDYLAAYFPGGFAFMADYFAVEKVASAEQFQRLCTLEYLFRQLSAAP